MRSISPPTAYVILLVLQKFTSGQVVVAKSRPREIAKNNQTAVLPDEANNPLSINRATKRPKSTNGTKPPKDSPSMSSSSPSVILPYAPSSAPTSTDSEPPSSTSSPSLLTSQSPLFAPSITASSAPSITPSFAPSPVPSSLPSLVPSLIPSFVPSTSPSSEHPSTIPSEQPSITPSMKPSPKPSLSPSPKPSVSPSSSPSMKPTNLVAKCGCATQSTTFVDTDSSRFQSAYKAIDGRKKHTFDQSAATGKEFNPFWQVDLMVDSSIEKIIIYSTDNEKAKVRNFKVTVTDKDRQEITPGYWHTDPLPPGSSFAIEQDYHNARFVIISMEGESVVLALSQVEVIGTNNDSAACTKCQPIFFDQCASSRKGAKTDTYPIMDPFFSSYNIQVNKNIPPSSIDSERERFDGDRTEVTMKCENGAFNLRSLWITSMVPDNLLVTIEGRKRGSLVIESKNITLETSFKPKFVDGGDLASFLGLDSAIFFSRTNVDVDSPHLFTIDDMYVEITSECNITQQISRDCPLESFVYENDLSEIAYDMYEGGSGIEKDKEYSPLDDNQNTKAHFDTDVANDLYEERAGDDKEISVQENNITASAFQVNGKKRTGNRKGTKKRSRSEETKRKKQRDISKKKKKSKERSTV